MVIMVVERARPSLRGELTRWMLEPRAGVFVGTLSALVRDRLWARVKEGMGEAGAMLIYTTDHEQGFALELAGTPSRTLIDFEGITLVQVPQKHS